jgi:hypothetical protein
MVLFWDVAPCSHILTDVSEMLIASIIRVTKVIAFIIKIAYLKRLQISKRLHGATSQKTAIFIPVAMRI